MRKLNVTVWNENEGRGEHDAYESGMNAAIVDFLNSSGEFGKLRAASLPQPEHGLSDEVLNDTDVLLWWGHSLHQLVSDGIVEKVRARILGGMGFIPLHSAHASKIFMKLMGTHTDRLRWRDAGERERVWKIAYGHPIAEGAPDYFDIPRSEMYGEHFHIPTPDELILVSWYEGGEVFRSGCVFLRGLGKIFYFSPGHETYPIFELPDVQKIIINAVKWAAPPIQNIIGTGHFKESPESNYS